MERQFYCEVHSFKVFHKSYYVEEEELFILIQYTDKGFCLLYFHFKPGENLYS